MRRCAHGSVTRSSAADAGRRPRRRAAAVDDVDGQAAERRFAGAGPTRPSPPSDPARRRARCRSPAASPRPVAGPGRTSRTAAAATSSGTPGPAVLDGQPDRSGPVAPRADPDRCVRAGVLGARCRAGWRAPGRGTRRRPRPAAGPPGCRRRSSARPDRRRAPARRRPRRGRRGRTTSRSGSQLAGLDPAHVEQVGHEPIERSASRSIDSAISRRSSGGHSTCGSISVPAAARIEASGVRRSCDTESSSADLSASLRRAISAAVASSAESVTLERRADLVGGRGQDAGLARVRRSLRSRRASATTEPSVRSPVADRRPAKTSGSWSGRAAGACRRRASAGASRPTWTRVHSAGRSPGRRRRTSWIGTTPARSPSAGVRDDAIARPPPRPVGYRPSSWTMSDDRRTARSWSGADASAKLTRNMARASARGRSRSRAVALAPGQLADDHPDDEQQEEVQPLLGVVDREACSAARRTGSRTAGTRRRRSATAGHVPATHRDRDDGQQVGRRGVGDAGRLQDARRPSVTIARLATHDRRRHGPRTVVATARPASVIDIRASIARAPGDSGRRATILERSLSGSARSATRTAVRGGGTLWRMPSPSAAVATGRAAQR